MSLLPCHLCLILKYVQWSGTFKCNKKEKKEVIYWEQILFHNALCKFEGLTTHTYSLAGSLERHQNGQISTRYLNLLLFKKILISLTGISWLNQRAYIIIRTKNRLRVAQDGERSPSCKSDDLPRTHEQTGMVNRLLMIIQGIHLKDLLWYFCFELLLINDPG